MKKSLYFIEYIRYDFPVLKGIAYKEATSPKIAVNEVANAAGCEVIVFMARSLVSRRAPYTYYGYINTVGVMRISQFIDTVDLMFANNELSDDKYRVINWMYDRIIDRSKTREEFYDLRIKEDTP